MKIKNAIPVYDICTLGNDADIHKDIIAENFASYLERHPNLHAAHGHSFYHFVLFTKGKGFHTVDFERYRVTEGQMYFMIPGQVHSWAFEGETDGYIINFSENLFRPFLADSNYLEQFDFLQGLPGNNIVQLPRTVQAEVRDLMARIVQETTTVKPLAPDLVRATLINLFIIVARVHNKKTGVADNNRPGFLLVQLFRRLVNEHYKEHRLPREYAPMLYVTPNHLNAVCRDVLGKSAGEIIRDRIVLEAKRQLVNADANIAGIGYELGFTDNSYFTKFFKKYTGTTPEDFRKKVLQTA
ncbi:AraC family transcriptional regulator [Chitinophagaceae bacterium MMS25-I14]